MAITSLTTSLCSSPLGGIQLVFLGDKLCYLDFAENDERMRRLLTTRFGQFQLDTGGKADTVSVALDRYFRGCANPFKDIDIDTSGTEFQQQVWSALTEIPSGMTMDYSALAMRVGKPKAIRAAASSNARNPVSILVPCHRVIGKDGSLRGYAGGEERKRWLLQHEGVCI